ncbi:MAG: flavodoxin family protein [Halobacteriota archaeon]
MKSLVVFYSRTGVTQTVGAAIVEALQSDVEELLDARKRTGLRGFLRSGREAREKKLTELQPTKLDPSDYDLVVIGTPIWASDMSSPVRTYITYHQQAFNHVAFFYTRGGTSDINAFREMQLLCGKAPRAALALTQKEVKSGVYREKVKRFVEQLRLTS